MTAPLQRVPYACLNGAYTVRLYDGCTAGCQFCYLRGEAAAPPPTSATLLDDSVEHIAQALGKLPRSALPLAHVIVDPDHDGFPADLAVQEMTYRLFRLLFDRKIGVTFFTKGLLTRRFVNLFATNRGRVRGRVALGTLDAVLAAQLEPGAASPEERLDTIRSLAELDALGDVRVDPLIPGLGDTDAALGALLERLRLAGATRAVVSYVHLRPAIFEVLERVVPLDTRRMLAEAYQTQPWVRVGAPTEVKLLPRGYREEGYLRFRQLAERYGIQVSVCQCKNPDLSGEACGAIESRIFPQAARGAAHDPERPVLFPC